MKLNYANISGVIAVIFAIIVLSWLAISLETYKILEI